MTFASVYAHYVTKVEKKGILRFQSPTLYRLDLNMWSLWMWLLAASLAQCGVSSNLLTRTHKVVQLRYNLKVCHKGNKLVWVKRKYARIGQHQRHSHNLKSTTALVRTNTLSNIQCTRTEVSHSQF